MLGMDTEEVLRCSDAVRSTEGTLRARIDQVDRTISGLDASVVPGATRRPHDAAMPVSR